MLKNVMNWNDKGAAEVEEEGWETEEEPYVAEYVEVEYTEAGSSGTKRRNPKRKRSYSGEVRRSGRKHIPVNLEMKNYDWSLEEKKNLLAAVKKYGHLDMQHLCEAVPQKSKSEIKTMIVKWWRRAAVVRQNEIDNKPLFESRAKKRRGVNKKNTPKKPELAPIEQWIEQLRKAGPSTAHAETKDLANSMLYISLFEKHPDPAECGGVDFSALYDYMYRMMMGYPPKELNEPTTKYLLSVMDKMAAEIKNGDFQRQMLHLRSVRKISLEPATLKQYGKRRGEDQNAVAPEDEWMKNLLEIPGFNPLSTSLSLLKLE